MNDTISELYSDTDLSPLSRVTLIIPTHNRNFYLSRCLWYHAHFPFAEIIVADSSSQNKRETNKKTILELIQLFQTKITYLEYDYPPEEYGGEIYRKWGDAINHATTDYSLSCTDKEFLIPTTVVNSVCFLDKHPDYSLADGIYYMMNSKNEIIHWQGDESITEDSPTKRLKQLISTKGIIGTQFALHRTKDYKHIFEMMNEYELFDIRFGETFIETFPFIKGKLNRENNAVMSIRDTTEYCKQNNIFNNITNNLKKCKAESSCSRYLPYIDYPNDRREELLYRYKKCIESSNLINENLEFYRSILDVRYDINNVKNKSFVSITNTKLFSFCWNSLIPYKLKYALSHSLGSAVVGNRIIPKNEPAHINCIFNMILKTRHYISTDTPITQTNIIQGDCK